MVLYLIYVLGWIYSYNDDIISMSDNEIISIIIVGSFNPYVLIHSRWFKAKFTKKVLKELME
eukprot:3800560-Ditylum_brightwellii.AAC.3